MKTHWGYCGVIIIWLIAICQISLSQTEHKSKISLKDGRILVGTVVERIPDKAIILKTASGNEIIDVSNVIKEEQYNPKIYSITPYKAESGSVVKIIGTDFGEKTAKSLVRFGTVVAAIGTWNENQITVTVPRVDAGTYNVTVSGDDFEVNSPVGFEIAAPNAGSKMILSQRRDLPSATKAEQPMQQQFNQPTVQSQQISRFLLQFAYATPLKEFKETSGDSTAGYAKPGFAGGWEARVALSDNFYMPFNMDVAFLGFNTDELAKQTGLTVTSDKGKHFVSWLSVGLGVAIPMGQAGYLFASGEYGLSYSEIPDIQISSKSPVTPFNITQESASAFTTGYGFSFGITFDAITVGYKAFFSRPKYTVHYSTGYYSSTLPDQDIEQPTSVGIIYMGINID